MRIAILMVLLVVNGNAMAEWVMVSQNIYATGYADPATVARDGNHAKMWTLVDCRVMSNFIGGSPFMSIKSQEEFDCGENRLRTLVYSLHSGNMGEGDEVFVDSNPSKWSSALADKQMKRFLEIACGSK
jgi:hypothetical protein